MRKVLFLSDGETWEELNDGIFIVELTEEEFQKLVTEEFLLQDFENREVVKVKSAIEKGIKIQ